MGKQVGGGGEAELRGCQRPAAELNMSSWEKGGVSGSLGAVGSRCSRSLTLSFVPRVFLALVEEAEDRGGVVAQGGGKVRGQAPPWGSGEGWGSAGVPVVWHWVPRARDWGKLGAP